MSDDGSDGNNRSDDDIDGSDDQFFDDAFD
jgi:hypothetical protein